ncbi:unnamed protein product [Rotaria sordida]|uniref:E3 ubiquitin-protein ligase n=2 Tax=Rotaria sordida TaxID=392033 RepID=A0A814GSF2_9BILA|nr:unnamed protein product [Rotaria sordida]
MDTADSTYLTPEELETGLVNGTIDKLELEKLLTNNIHENENIDTLVHFFQQYIPGNRTMDEFIEKIRQYNSAQICGLVWNAQVIAYRCKTCSISPCMSICAQCFQNGNHEGHNYNMFKSQAGGACDCGDSSVMHEFGFCRFHGENRPKTQMVPRELICCAELLIPHLLKVFIRALRMSTVSGDIVTEQKLLEILNQLSNGGSAIQLYITNALSDRNLYEEFTTDLSMIRLYHYEYLTGEYSTLPVTFFVESLMNDSTSNSLIPFDTSLHTMLDEIMMWCVTANLPEDLVRFLLSLLPDFNFKLLFTETFLRFYGVIAQSLIDESLVETSEIPSRLVHISVQLFSSNIIAEYAMEKCHLIEVIISCIWHMFIPSTEHDRQDDDVDDDENILKAHPLALAVSDSTTGMVIDVEHRLIVKNVYWPLLSDFVNILSQEKIAFTIMENQKYINLWLRFLTLFQGMNINERILTQHIEYEPQAYMYAFTIELEISAAAMWCFVGHLKPNYPSEKLICVIKQIIDSINDWMQSLNFDINRMDDWKLTFHLPLHRYLSVFAYNTIYQYNIDPSLFLPVDNEKSLLNLMFYPLRTICGYYEVLSNIWLRNGQQVTIQAKTYAKSAFSSSMHDADLFLLQLLSCYIEPNIFVESLLRRFHVYSWLFPSVTTSSLDSTQLIAMLESVLIALCAIVGFQPNIAFRETKQIRAEIITTLAVADRLYSEVEENVPDPSPLSANRKEIEIILEQVSDFQTPSVELLGHLQQGKYTIKGELFKTEYDPLHVIMRCTKRAHFQNSLERFTNYIKHEGLFKSDYPIWPPFRIPTYYHSQMSNVQRILRSGVLHNFLFLCLNAYLNDKTITENILYFTIYLLELSLLNGEDTSPMAVDENSEDIVAFKTNNIFTNIRTRIFMSHNPLKNETEAESIITLLLKILHKQRSNDFFNIINNISLQQKINNPKDMSRIGDAYYFISNIFSLSSQMNEQCRITIKQEIEKFKTQHQQQQPTNTKTSELTAEQKRQRAKNRQLKLLAEIAESQKKFISQQNPDETSMSVGTPPSFNNEHLSTEQTITTATASNITTHTENSIDYECCVCRIAKSDSQSPIGLIGTSCLSLLPSLEFAQLDEYEQNILSYNSNKITLETYLNITKQSLTQISGHSYIANYCQNDHHLRSLLIQSCGHSIHVDCLSSYLKALHPNQEAAEVSVNNLLPPNTNFRCPLCRQTANALIPLFDYNDYLNIEDNKQNLTSIERLHQSMINPLRPNLKRSSDESCLLAFLSGLAAKCVSTEQLSANIPMVLPNHQSMKQRAAEFDCGTLRAQLVHEQLFYESVTKIDQKNIRKSFYKILHDLHHLGYPFHHQHLWQELTGLQCPSTTIDVFDAHQPLAPILVRDSITMLLQLLMSAPINLTSDEFDIIVQVVFNIEFFKSLISIVTEQSIENKDLTDLNDYMDLTKKYIKDITTDDEQIINRKPIDNLFQNQLMNNCLEFLKITSLIKYRLYTKEMPWITGEQPSALALANFLNLKLNLNGLAMPQWYCNEPVVLVTNWLQDFQISTQHHRSAMKILCLKRPYFYPPIFIDLPAKYDDLFHVHNEYRCEHCKKVSSNTLLCLICGELHLKRWYPVCCIYQRQRYTQHLAKCGHPAAIMLDIQTTLIAICLTDTYAYWHSLYLDQHGEEDPKLKRGKTLYLNLNRLAVLRTLWLTATFDYQIQNWLSYMSLMISHFDPILYSYYRRSCSHRVRIALNLKNIIYQIQPIDLLKGEASTDKYKKINPKGEIPVLLIDGKKLTQSLPIIEYLDETHKTPRLLPDNPYQRYQARMISEIIASGIQPLQNLSVLKRVGDEKKVEWTRHYIKIGLDGK